MFRRIAVLLSVSLVTVAVTSGADAKSKSKSKGKTFDVCKLLTDPEVASALGEGVQKKHGGSSSTGARFCNWFGDDQHVLQETLNVIAAKTSAAQRFKLYKKQFHLTTPVSGVGKQAATDGTAVAAYSNRGFIYIAQGGWNGHGSLSALEGLAKAALSRL